MSRELKNHPGFELREDAADAFDAYEDAHGILALNSARRFEWEQQELINRWDAGGALNRPPYLYPPGRPASDSPHVRNGGVAVDVADYRKFREHSQDYGFVWYGSLDVVHFDFIGWNGKTVNTETETGDDEMTATFVNVQGKAGSHRAGTFAIMRDNGGKLFARRVSYDSFATDAPLIPNTLFKAWQDTMPFAPL